MQKIITSLFLLLMFGAVQAQTLSPKVIASGGGYATSIPASLSWTMGETNINTLQNGVTILSQGFEQPELDILTGSVILHLKMFIEGYYLGGGLMKPVLYNEGVDPNPNSTNVDTVTVCLVDSALVVNDPYNPYKTGGQPPAYTGFWINDTVATAKGLLQTDGSLSVTFSGVPAINKYYVAIRQRGMVCTWSAHPISIYDGRFYDFTTSADSVYGSNEVENYDQPTWSFYSGDWNQDENVDALDFPAFDYEQSNFYFGYYPTDLNGDGNVDIYDYRIFNLNQADFIYSQHP